MKMSSGRSFHLFTSLRYDPLLLSSEENSSPIVNFESPSPFYMLIYHRDRMLEAAQHFDFHAVAKKLEDGLSLHKELLHKVNEYLQQGGKDGPLKVSYYIFQIDEDNELNVDHSYASSSTPRQP